MWSDRGSNGRSQHHESVRLRVMVLFAFFMLLLFATPPVRTLIALPHHIRLIRGEVGEISRQLPVKLHIRADKGNVLINGKPLMDKGWRVLDPGLLRVQPMRTGQYHLELRAFGFLPIRRVTLDVVDPMVAIPSGESIGVIVNPGGVVVVDESPVNVNGERVFPAGRAGIKRGDLIVAIDGKPIRDKEKVASFVAEAGRYGKDMVLTVLRRDERMKKVVKPLFDAERQRYLLGLWIRDGTTGIGTMTFVEPATRRYAALGHLITDEEGMAVRMGSGKVVDAYISGVRPGKAGAPGEKIGVFVNQNDTIGTIDRNTPLGIYGEMHKVPQGDPLPVALENDVHVGPAQLLTVVQGHEPELFDMRIERVFPQGHPTDKGMVVRITDKRLLSITGGIVQGMSGSPILQNGRLVGAVTHVFVNDPIRGYAVFAEWMIKELRKPTEENINIGGIASLGEEKAAIGR